MSPRGKTTIMLQSKPDSSLDFSKSLDIWYTDGSVVLVADKTGFRVHTSILASHCEVFRDMVSIPQPESADGSETYESCPVLRLQDSHTDLHHFLKTIYDFSYFRPGVKNKFVVAAAVLRFSTKYLAPVLRQQAIDMLLTAYPSSFDAWQRRETDRLVSPIEEEFSTMTALAEQTDTRVFLPSVFFAATKRPLAEILQQLQALPLNDSARAEISKKFLLGREKLRRELEKEVLGFLHPGYVRNNCQTSNDNSYILNAAQKALVRLTDEEPYYIWCINNSQEVGRSMSLCQNCCNTVQSHIESAVGAVWDRLPGIFGLPEWAVLKADETSS